MKNKFIKIISLVTFILIMMPKRGEAIYENYVNNIPVSAAITSDTQDVQQELEAKVQELVNAGHMAPTLHYIGLGGNPIIFYNTPTETIYTLSIVYPYLSSPLKTAVKAYLDKEIRDYPPHSQKYFFGTNYGKVSDMAGARREYFVPDPNASFWYQWEAGRPLFLPALYAIWAYSNNTGDWTYAANNYAALKAIYTDFKSAGGIASYPELAGAIGFARMAQHQGQALDYNDALAFAETGFSSGLNFAQFLTTAKARYPDAAGAATIQGYTAPIFMFHRNPAALFFSREIGQFLKDHVFVESAAYAEQVIHDVPLGWLTAGGISHGESTYSTPEIPWTYFMLRSYAAGDSVSQLKSYLDAPDRKGDLFYLQKLVAIIEANLGVQVSVAGDINNDTFVNVLDVQACVNHILGIQNLGNSADVNQDGSVDVLDVQAIVNIILGG